MAEGLELGPNKRAAAPSIPLLCSLARWVVGHRQRSAAIVHIAASGGEGCSAAKHSVPSAAQHIQAQHSVHSVPASRLSGSP